MEWWRSWLHDFSFVKTYQIVHLKYKKHFYDISSTVDGYYITYSGSNSRSSCLSLRRGGIAGVHQPTPIAFDWPVWRFMQFCKEDFKVNIDGQICVLNRITRKVKGFV
jgi:hypothetical protein